MRFRRIGVVGAGAWGTALALAAARAGREAVLLGRDPETAQAINRRHENLARLPGVRLPPAVTAVTRPAGLAGCDCLLLAVPAQSLRQVASDLAAVRPPLPLIVCAKGLERGTGLLMTEVLERVWPAAPCAVLSGPSFAAEIGAGKPAAITLAAADPGLARDLAAAIGSTRFRPYYSGDPVGAQVGGAVKNVAAIACGIATGRGFGENARAALITRALAEITRLATGLGGRPETLMGLAGFGDLVLSCSSRQSRNFRFGERLGAGTELDRLTGSGEPLAEGVASAAAVRDRAGAAGVEMPITRAVAGVLAGEIGLTAAIDGLLARPPGAETGG